MRNFVDKKAGATFLKGYSYTYAVRQNHIELILKVNKGLYGVVWFQSESTNLVLHVAGELSLIV